jgi:hypothetical protein
MDPNRLSNHTMATTEMMNTTDIPYHLTPEQEVSFHCDGFLLLSDVMTHSEVDDLQRWTAEVKGWPNRKGEHMPYEETRADGTTGLCR